MLTLDQLVAPAHPADRVSPEGGGLSARAISERLWASDDDVDMEEKAGSAFKNMFADYPANPKSAAECDAMYDQVRAALPAPAAGAAGGDVSTKRSIAAGVIADAWAVGGQFNAQQVIEVVDWMHTRNCTSFTTVYQSFCNAAMGGVGSTFPPCALATLSILGQWRKGAADKVEEAKKKLEKNRKLPAQRLDAKAEAARVGIDAQNPWAPSQEDLNAHLLGSESEGTLWPSTSGRLRRLLSTFPAGQLLNIQGKRSACLQEWKARGDNFHGIPVIFQDCRISAFSTHSRGARPANCDWLCGAVVRRASRRAVPLSARVRVP
jgi:hypothetical protein